MPDPLSHLIDACAAISFVAEGAGIAPVEIRLVDERDARKLIALLNMSETVRQLSSPIDEKGHEFKIGDVRVTWPQ